MKYDKRDDDKQFRVINLNLNDVEEIPFQNFSKDVVDYPEGCVIEVCKLDGSKHIEYERERQSVNVCVFRDNLFIPAHVPVARLWVKERGRNSIWYKVPLHLKVENNNAYIMIPGNPGNVDLVGDAYFNAAYDLRRI